jgi:hypothetical protein
VREKVRVRGCYCFVEVDLGLGAGLYYYGAGLVAENAIAGKLVSLDEADELECAYWPAAALPKACSLEESKGLLAMSLGGMLCYGSVWLCCTTVYCGWC